MIPLCFKVWTTPGGLLLSVGTDERDSVRIAGAVIPPMRERSARKEMIVMHSFQTTWRDTADAIDGYLPSVHLIVRSQAEADMLQRFVRPGVKVSSIFSQANGARFDRVVLMFRPTDMRELEAWQDCATKAVPGGQAVML